MKLPKMSAVEAAVFGAVFARETGSYIAAVDNRNAEAALEAALQELSAFRMAVRERTRD